MVTTALRTPDDLQANAEAAFRLERARSLQPCNLTDTEICPPSKFRQPTGECNNVSHRKWGARGDILLRLIAPDYADGISQPRTSHGTHALPDADTVIEQLQNHVDAELRHPHITAMLPAWGQLLANDMYEVSQLSTSPKCCNENANANVKNPDELQQCYVRRGADCKEYKRSAPGYDAGICNKRKTSFLFSLFLQIFIIFRAYRSTRTDECRFGLHRWLRFVWRHVEGHAGAAYIHQRWC